MVGLCAEWIRPQGAFGRRSAYADRKDILCVGEGRRPARSAREGRFQSAWKPAAGGRLAPTEKSVGGGRRLARKRLWRPISIGGEAFGWRSACA